MKTRILSVALLLIFAGSSVNLFAQQRGERKANKERIEKVKVMKQKAGERGGWEAGIPGLTDEQKEAIKTLHLELRKDMLPVQNQLREKAARMKTLTTAEDYNRSAVHNLIDDMADLKTEIAKMKADTHQEVRMQLTEEQRIIFDSRPKEQAVKKRMVQKMKRQGKNK